VSEYYVICLSTMEMNLTDKSDPDTIREEVGMSKKSFKSAIGMLYKQKLVVINSDHIRLGDF